MTDFPGGPVVKYPPANAGDTGLVPGPGRFHMPRGNEAHAPLVRPLYREPVLHNKKRRHNET